MRNILLGTIAVCLLFTLPAQAQSTFWGFDENNEEIYIPVQCDGQFDETHGGVFMPTPEELYEQGEVLLLEKDNTRSGAGYCLLSSAIQGYVPAQLRVAQLYNKGLILPQNDIAAYRWAFLASLNGNKEAEQLALTLEQLLSTEEIQTATQPLEPMLPNLKKEKDESLKEQEEILKEKKEKLEKLNKEIDSLLGIKYRAPKMKTVEDIRKEAARRLEEKEKSEEKQNPKKEVKKTGAVTDSVKQKQIQLPQKENQRIRRKPRGAVQRVPEKGNIFGESDRLR